MDRKDYLQVLFPSGMMAFGLTSQALIPFVLRKLRGFQHGFRGIPVSKNVAGDVVWIDVGTTIEPLVL